MISFLSAARTRISPTILGIFLLAPLGWAVARSPEQASPPQDDGFHVQLFEDLPAHWHHEWSFRGLEPSLSWATPVLGISGLPGRISPAGMTMPRNRPFALTIQGDVNLPGGDYEFRLRSRMHARFFLDGRLLLESAPPKPQELTPEELAAKEAAEKKARDEAAQKEAESQARQDLLRQRLEDALLEQNEETQKAVAAELGKVNRRQRGEYSDTQPPAGIQDSAKKVSLESDRYRLRIELTGQKLDREISIVYRKGEEEWRLLSRGDRIPFTERAWVEWNEAESRRHRELEDSVRKPRLAKWERYWKQLHLDQARAVAASRKPVDIEPAAGMPEFNLVDRFLGARMAAHQVEPAPLTNDYEFVRRIYIDVWGLIPTWEQVREFVNDSAPEKRNLLIDRLLADDGWADPWVGYWQDLLGENPKLYGGVPHSTGPFKEWVHRSFVEDRGYDRFATELLLMEGTPEQLGTLGFHQSFGSDVPMAEKAHVISQAFMGATMKCARCHDSPLNRYRQRDLFGIAAMLEGKPVGIPETSSVGEVPGRRKPAVPVTSKPGDLIPPSFVFDEDRGLENVGEGIRAHRKALAAWMVSQRRFAQVGVNRIWQRFMGRGLAHPIDDWDSPSEVSHPELLEYLTGEFIGSGFSVRRVQELILKSHAYQRRRGQNLADLRDATGRPFFAAPGARRMRAEEIVDSLHVTVRRPFKSERIAYQKLDYGVPQRTWQIVSLSNEEDISVLAKPLLQEIITLARAFGWRDQRPNPVSVRNDDPHALQPLAMANGELMHRLVKFTDRSYYTELSKRAATLDQYGERLFLNTLSRLPTDREKRWLSRELGTDWDQRLVPPELQETRKEESRVKEVTITDSIAAQEYIMQVRQGEPATAALTPSFRRQAEKVLWAVLNSPEFIFLP
ncbi:MAG: DUF1549 domain-containing protein [Candidatus Aminicenantes bacterium]|nr:DUF1549 domain-containing protein [Candidatus Aminicenantes bacterium]